MPVTSYLPAEIIDYLETHAPPEDAGFGISQRELAKALGYHACSMSRPLAGLVKDGYLRTHRGVVRGGERKQFVYRVTDEGRAYLQKQTKDVPMLSGALPPPPNPFLGRREELQELWRYSLEGGEVIFVEGPPGMGKTALIARHIRRLKAGRIPFWFTLRPGSSPRHFATALARALSTIGAQQLAYYSQLPRQPVGREVADLAARALGERTIIVVLDDLQAASGDMRRFIVEFTEGLARGRRDLYFFVGQEAPFFEPKELKPRHLVVGGLDRSAAHDLTDRRGGLADRFESVYQASLGSPLLLQLAVSNPGVEASASALPAAVIGRLAREELLALLPIALANEPIPASFISQAGGISPARLDRLVQGGVLQRSLEGRVELLQVVRTALMERAGPGDESVGHLKLAAFYGRSHRPEAVRERFLHLVAAEAWKEAARLVATQERTLLSLGYSDPLRGALRHLSLAMPKGAARVRALRVEAAVLRMHSEFSEAILALRRGIVEAEGDRRIEAESLCQIVELHVRMRQLEEAERALADARQKGPFTRRLQVYLMLSEARIVELRGDVSTSQAMYQQVFEFAKSSRVADLSLESIAAWSRTAFLGGNREVALSVVGEALPGARASGRLDIVFGLLLVRARAYAEIGEREQAEAEMRIIRTEAEALGYLNQLTYTLSGLAAMAVEAQRWGDVVNYARQASALAERLGNDLVYGHTLAIQCSGELRQGRIEEARLHGEQGVSILSRLPPSDSLMIAHAYLSEVYLELRDLERARVHFDSAYRLADSMGIAWWKSQLERELKGRLDGVPGAPTTA